MIEYKIEDFQAWLEANPVRKRGLEDWASYLAGNYFAETIKDPYSPNYYDAHALTIKEWVREVNEAIFNRKQELETELATERETTQQALQTSQTWHERQKNEIITQWKTKLTNFLNSRKQKLLQEINLIKEVLNE